MFTRKKRGTFATAIPILIIFLGISIITIQLHHAHRLLPNENVHISSFAVRDSGSTVGRRRRDYTATITKSTGGNNNTATIIIHPNNNSNKTKDHDTATAETPNKIPSSSSSSSSWMDNLSQGIPIQSRGKVYISLGVCCSKEAQQNTQKETRRHDHSTKPYDVATVLAASLWSMQMNTNRGHTSSEVSIFVALGYIKGNEESERNLNNLQMWLHSLNSNNNDDNDGSTNNNNIITTWPYDVSSFPNPYYACIRAGQIGRYYAHESKMLQPNDFVMTSDSDIFPTNSTALLPFIHETNKDGEYHRVFIRDWAFTCVEGVCGTKTIPLFGIGQTVYDWNRSLAGVNAPTLRDAIGRASEKSTNTWGFDQRLSTMAVRYGGLCHFPTGTTVTSGGSAGGKQTEVAKEGDDAITCYKGNGSLRKECLNSYSTEKTCLYSHFTPDGTASLMRRVYDAIAADTHPKGRSHKTADMILGKEKKEGEEDDELSVLRQLLRPGVKYPGSCQGSFKRRSCGVDNGGKRPHSLPFVSGDFFRCIADIVYDETNNYQPHGEDIQCLFSLKSQPEFARQPFLVFVKTDLVHNEPGRLKDIDATIPGPYILITHNSDFSIANETQKQIEALPKLIHWYGQHLPGGNRRTTIPIGIENRKWGRIYPEYYTQVATEVSKQQKKESALAVASFRPRNVERRTLLERLRSTDWVDTPQFGYYGSTITHEAWLKQQAEYKFAISPPGNGVDCHRTWEMILIGVVPVMRESFIDSIFASQRSEGAILLVKDWNDLNRTLLDNHWRKYGGGLLQRRESWMKRPDNVMLAKHWIHRFTLHSDDSRMLGTISSEERNALVKQIGFVTYGNDAYAVAKKRIVNEATETGWFGLGAKGWGPEDLSLEFQQKYQEVLELPRGGGYWMWKFYVIEQTMATMKEGQFLVYLDAGSQLNKNGEKRFYEYIKMVNESQYDLIGFRLPFLEYKWTTPMIFRAFNVTGNSSIIHSGQIEANTIIFQKGPHYRKWMALCKSIIDVDPWILTDKYNEEAKKLNTEFKENRHDQSIMSVARKKLGYVRVDGYETKNSDPDKPFHVMRKKD